MRLFVRNDEGMPVKMSPVKGRADYLIGDEVDYKDKPHVITNREVRTVDGEDEIILTLEFKENS